MVRLTLHQLLRQRGISAYALSRGAGLSYPSAYRLSRPAGAFGRLNADTLDRVCEFLQVQPGDLLRWTPGRNGKRGGRRRSG
jgi:putative transcriptional regulator